jgi:hypothetical protein
VVTGGVVLAAWAQAEVWVVPPWQWAATPLVAVAFAVLWAALDRLTRTAAFARWQAPVEAVDGPPAAVPVPAWTGGTPAS